ncbi:MAG: cobalamin B12-binding domain-containing protein [Actinomycetota bacterium]
MTDTPIRVLVGKVGLDGHDRGVKVVARALRDAGMEIIYTGLHRKATEVVHVAVQEDVDVIGISVLSGAHMTIFPQILDLLREHDADDVLLIGGGTILQEDVEELERLGVARVFGVDTPLGEIIEFIRANAGRRM